MKTMMPWLAALGLLTGCTTTQLECRPAGGENGCTLKVQSRVRDQYLAEYVEALLVVAGAKARKADDPKDGAQAAACPTPPAAWRGYEQYLQERRKNAAQP